VQKKVRTPDLKSAKTPDMSETWISAVGCQTSISVVSQPGATGAGENQGRRTFSTAALLTILAVHTLGQRAACSQAWFLCWATSLLFWSTVQVRLLSPSNHSRLSPAEIVESAISVFVVFDPGDSITVGGGFAFFLALAQGVDTRPAHVVLTVVKVFVKQNASTTNLPDLSHHCK